MKLQSKAEQKKEKDSSSFCSPEKKRIFAEKETFSSIPVNAEILPDQLKLCSSEG